MPAKLIAAAIFVLLVSGCHRTQPASPAADYERIHADFVRGHLDLAREMASAKRQEFSASNAEWSFRFCLLQAEALSYQGRSQDVVNALRVADAGFSPQGDLAVKQALLLSVAYARTGQTQRSEEQWSKAKSAAKVASSSMQAEVLQTAGLLQNRRGQQAEAVKSFLNSLQLARKNNDAFLEATNMLNLGRVALQSEHIDEALDWFNASTRLAQSIHADAITQNNLGNAGWAYFELGDFERALDSFRQAETQARNLGSSDNEILWFQSVGLTLYRLGDLEGARSNYEQALAKAQQTGHTARAAEAQTSLGLLYLQLGKLNIAQSYAGDALRETTQVGDAAGALDARLLAGLIAAGMPPGAVTATALAFLYQDCVKLPSLRWQIENAYAGMYSRNNKPEQAEVWFRRSIQTFEAQRSSVTDEESRLPFFANGDALYREYADFLISSGRSDQALSLLDRAQARTLEEGLAPGRTQRASSVAIEPQRVAAKAKGTILFYSLGPQRSYLWAIAPDRTRLFPLPSEREIIKHVQAYQAGILKSSDPLQDQNAEAQWLYQTLVAPTEDGAKTSSRIFLVRGAGLGGLNFETLLRHGAQGLHYWVDDVSITSISSIGLLARAAQSSGLQKHDRNLLLFGNPLSPGSEYPVLANAAGEVERISKYFSAGNRTAITQAGAVPAAYQLSRPDQYAYIHFVAHGTASTLRPLDSAIVLSPPSSQPDSFKLYAREIVHHPIAADLVTISACYGSGMRDFAGEGLVGLAWAFLRAGAHNVIGATWAVDDASTAQLMDRLYQELTSGQPPDEALRRAKLSLVHSTGVYRKPLYWAGFQLYAGS